MVGLRSAVEPRVAVRILAAVALAVAVDRLLPLPDDDPLRSTLVMVAPVVAALREIGRWALARGARRRHALPATWEVVGLLLLVVLALGRDSLGLRHGEALAPLLFAALASLLAVRVGRLMLALRPSLGGKLPRRPPAAFFLLPLVVYLAILPWSTERRPPDGDEPYYLLITHSLAYDFDERLSENYERGDSLAFMDRRLDPQPGDPVGADGERYSRHNLTLPLLLAPAYRLAGKLGALAMMAALTAALAWATLSLARHYRPGSPGAALLAWAAFAFAAPLLLYSHQVWVEVPAALLVVVTLERIHRLREGEALGASGWLVLGACLMLLPLLKFRLVFVGVGLVLLLLVAGLRRRRGPTLAALGGLAAASAAILAVNQLLFGNPLRYYSLAANLRLYRTEPVDYLRGLAGVFGDCAFGLVACAPIWILIAAGLVGVGRHRRLLLDLGLGCAPYLVLIGPRGSWYGGWCPPFRYAMVALPVLAMLLIPALEGRRRRGSRVLLSALGAVTALLTLLWVALPGWTYNLADGRSHLLDFLSRLLAGDAARFFPSYVRLRPASWIWPLAAILLVVLWRLGRRARNGTWRWGIVTVLAAAALLPVAVRSVPSRVVEFEDPYVGRSGGGLHPERWTIGRERFRGGWTLGAGDRLEAPLVPGGESLALEIDLLRQRAGGTLELVVGDGGELRWRLPVPAAMGYQTVEAGPVPWRGDRPLVLEVAADDAPARGATLILDRARLRWR